ncbi:MAG: hypothetical protein WBW73_29930, partial [Rhodoplanes sp.]
SHPMSTASCTALHGANPADLPVQAPTRYETAIDLRTVDSDTKCNALHRLASSANSSAKKRSRFKSPASTGL